MYADQDSLDDAQIVARNIQRLREADVSVTFVVDAKDDESERIRTHLLNMKVISYPYVQLFRRNDAIAFGGLLDQDTLNAIRRELEK